jgi:hypothetical protein
MVMGKVLYPLVRVRAEFYTHRLYGYGYGIALPCPLSSLAVGGLALWWCPSRPAGPHLDSWAEVLVGTLRCWTAWLRLDARGVLVVAGPGGSASSPPAFCGHGRSSSVFGSLWFPNGGVAAPGEVVDFFDCMGSDEVGER